MKLFVFSKLLNNEEGSDLKEQRKLLSLTPKVISDDQNKMINESFSLEEVSIALNKLPSDKVPGPDGFPTGFYKWEIIGNDLVEALKFARRSGNLLKEIYNTFIAFIPKKEKATHLEDYRPISLCNIICKILLKVMTNRLKSLMDSIISEEQTGFIPGRLILDKVIVA